jgi:hypothetical protein
MHFFGVKSDAVKTVNFWGCRAGTSSWDQLPLAVASLMELLSLFSFLFNL